LPSCANACVDDRPFLGCGAGRRTGGVSRGRVTFEPYYCLLLAARCVAACPPRPRALRRNVGPSSRHLSVPAAVPPSAVSLDLHGAPNRRIDCFSVTYCAVLVGLWRAVAALSLWRSVDGCVGMRASAARPPPAGVWPSHCATTPSYGDACARWCACRLSSSRRRQRWRAGVVRGCGCAHRSSSCPPWGCDALCDTLCAAS
jgi:hypothetical protein